MVCGRWYRGPPAIAEKARSGKPGFCPDATKPILSGLYPAYHPFSKICPDPLIRVFFRLKMSGLVDLACQATSGALKTNLERVLWQTASSLSSKWMFNRFFVFSFKNKNKIIVNQFRTKTCDWFKKSTLSRLELTALESYQLTSKPLSHGFLSGYWP
jgi:hypothetical protein